MENLEVTPTPTTPHVKLDAKNGKLFLGGRSIPEDPDVFYARIFNWVDQYFGDARDETEIEFRLEYVNSGSSKYMLELLREIERLSGNGKTVRIIWCYETDDESIQELGEHYQATVKLPFEIIEVPPVEEEEEE